MKTPNGEFEAPLRVAHVMRSLDAWWAIAGGWAIDLWLGESTREHDDVEVAIRRDEQAVVGAVLACEFELAVIDPPGSGWRALVPHTTIEPPAFQLKASSTSLEFDVFLESADGDVWLSRRDPRVRRPIAESRVMTEVGVPVIAPEVQLLYMAKSNEPKTSETSMWRFHGSQRSQGIGFATRCFSLPPRIGG